MTSLNTSRPFPVLENIAGSKRGMLSFYGATCLMRRAVIADLANQNKEIRMMNMDIQKFGP